MSPTNQNNKSTGNTSGNHGTARDHKGNPSGQVRKDFSSTTQKTTLSKPGTNPPPKK